MMRRPCESWILGRRVGYSRNRVQSPESGTPSSGEIVSGSGVGGGTELMLSVSWETPGCSSAFSTARERAIKF
jgi:hypothetical protein